MSNTDPAAEPEVVAHPFNPNPAICPPPGGLHEVAPGVVAGSDQLAGVNQHLSDEERHAREQANHEADQSANGAGEAAPLPEVIPQSTLEMQAAGKPQELTYDRDGHNVDAIDLVQGFVSASSPTGEVVPQADQEAAAAGKHTPLTSDNDNAAPDEPVGDELPPVSEPVADAETPTAGASADAVADASVEEPTPAPEVDPLVAEPKPEA
jgi:hypothetical protein